MQCAGADCWLKAAVELGSLWAWTSGQVSTHKPIQCPPSYIGRPRTTSIFLNFNLNMLCSQEVHFSFSISHFSFCIFTFLHFAFCILHFSFGVLDSGISTLSAIGQHFVALHKVAPECWHLTKRPVDSTNDGLTGLLFNAVAFLPSGGCPPLLHSWGFCGQSLDLHRFLSPFYYPLKLILWSGRCL